MRDDEQTALLVLVGLYLWSKVQPPFAAAQAASQQFGANVYSATHPGSQYPVASHRGNTAQDAVYATAVRAGFPDPDMATAIAMAESGGNPASEGDNGTSIGLWQIHLPAWPQYTRVAMLDPMKNAQAAFAISKGGVDWSPWSTFKSGAFRRYMP